MTEYGASNTEKKLRRLDRSDGLMRIFEVVVLGTVVILAMFSLLRVNQNIEEHRYQVETANKTAEEQNKNYSFASRAMLDVGLCIVSVPPTTRTPEYVKGCYDQIEKQYNIKLQRFGDGQ